MTLGDLLAQKRITTALVVDDVCDAVPTATDIGPENEAWAIFNDDLTAEQRQLIEAAYEDAKDRSFDELVSDDTYVAAVWGLRDTLTEVAAPLFEQYLADQASDQTYVDVVVQKLRELGLECRTSGRDFIEAAQEVDLIVIDLFFNKAQDEAALHASKRMLRDAIEKRRATPPLVILMSRSPRLEDKREEFRDEVGLLDSGFRIIRKSELEEAGKLERQLERLAHNADDSRMLARFFESLEQGMAEATSRTLKLLRNLRLSDIGQIQQLLLNAEGEPAGSYLVDVFDRVLQHEIERERQIIDAAIPLNAFSAVSHPSPYVAGSPALQELVERLLTQNSERLRLPGSLEAQVTFGDVLQVTEGSDLDRLRTTIAVDLDANTVLLVLTPVCDLQRNGAPRILLLVGKTQPLGVTSWKYGDDARTAAIRLDDEVSWIKWNLKHIDTVSHEQLSKAFDDNDLKVVARLREAHALELQQRVLSGLGRVGLVAAMPATFAVDVEIYHPDSEGVPVRLDVPALNDGAVCFVGREDNGNPALRLVMTDVSCDGVLDALNKLDPDLVAPGAQAVLSHVQSSEDLRKLLETGLDLNSAKSDSWTYIPSISGEQALAKMGLLAWNYDFAPEVLGKKDLPKAGVIILVKDREQADAVGRDEAIRSGLLPTEPDSEPSPD